MKIALTSARLVDKNVEYNISQIERYIIKGKESGAELVCFGETFLQGFNCFAWDFEEDKQIAISADSKTFARIASLTLKYKTDLLFGYAELDGDSIYSSCALIRNGKLLHNYRRISKGWKEYTKTDSHYKEGTDVTVFDYNGKKCAIALCGDLWDDPERFALGEDILFWPVYVCWPEEEWEREVKFDYARQASLCCKRTLFFNPICDGDSNGACAYFCDGKIQSELKQKNEDILIIEI